MDRPAAGADECLRQATGVKLGGRGLLIEGPPGCGKSALALTLIDRGAQLIGDDGVALTTVNGQLIASPPRATAGMIEIRNVGLVHVPCTAGPVALALLIDPAAPRFVEAAASLVIEGVAIPQLRFACGGSADAVRAEFALATHGLSCAA